MSTTAKPARAKAANGKPTTAKATAPAVVGADLAAAVAAATDRLALARRARARAEHELDAARAAAATAKATLVEQFGVSTVDEAKTALAGLEADLAAALDTLRTELDLMEGP